MDIPKIKAIDVHAHYGTDLAGDREIPGRFMRGDVQELIRRARLANIELSIVSPLEGLFPRFGANPVSGNKNAMRDLSGRAEVMQWVILDPLKEQTYAQAQEILSMPQCAGIKIHPEEHGYPIKEHGAKIFEFAAKHHAVIQTHSGESNSRPADFVPFINGYPEVTLILSHLGCSDNDDRTQQVAAIEKSRHGNVFVDTSSAASVFSGLIEWAVRQVGAEKILFGTDGVLYFEPMMRARIDFAEISDMDKEKILRSNAIKLFGLNM